MSDNLIAHATTTIAADPEAVWKALTDADAIREYMFGAEVESDWQRGSPITWRGEMHGTPFEDRGTVLDVEPAHHLQYDHYSPASGRADVQGNHHVVSIELTPEDHGTRVVLTQDGNHSVSEREHAASNWQQMLAGLKRYAEHA